MIELGREVKENGGRRERSEMARWQNFGSTMDEI
jgi:hypothetical protein